MLIVIALLGAMTIGIYANVAVDYQLLMVSSE
jgi:hypothetical protein